MTDVQLYIYDLSRGVARQMSLGLLGKQIDAVYHTSIVMNEIEYVYDGGIKAVPAGKTHLGPPMKTALLGKTELPMDVIMEYLESLKEVYTYETYDIWTHNCNNFSNDFAIFLVGRGIPDYISNLPQDVLRSPFGQMLKPYVDQMARQAQSGKGGLLGIDDTEQIKVSDGQISVLKTANSIAELEKYLQAAQESCAIVFFTSQNCGPCKALYPQYQKMGIDAQGKATFIIVDIVRSQDAGLFYSIKSTPTFITFLRGTLENRWSGSDPVTLKGNLDMLLMLAYPPHPHDRLSLPEFHTAKTEPIVFTKIPPLAKLKNKLGSLAEDNVVLIILQFLSSQTSNEQAKVTPPDLGAFSRFLHNASSRLPPEDIFAVVDLFRLVIVNPDFGIYFAQENDHKTVVSFVSYVNSLQNCPYSLRLVTLQLCCNLFANKVYHSHVLGCNTLSGPIITLLTTSLLDDNNESVRVASASLAFNITVSNRVARLDTKRDILPDDEQVEIAAALLEAIKVEKQSSEAIKGYLLALANLVFRSPRTGELLDLLDSLDSVGIVSSKQKFFPEEPLVKEISEVLLREGS